MWPLYRTASYRSSKKPYWVAEGITSYWYPATVILAPGGNQHCQTGASIGGSDLAMSLENLAVLV